MKDWRDTLMVVSISLLTIGASLMFAVLAWALITGRLSQ